jgi:hypothetical protein
VVITAASFPTPDRIKQTNNPAAWDQLAKFADLQAAVASQAVAELSDLIDRQGMRAVHAYRRLYREISAWRHQVSQQPIGERPGVTPGMYQDEINRHRPNVDVFGPGLRRDGGRFDAESRTMLGGVDTPASRLTERLAHAAQARFDTEASTEGVLDNKVILPDGSLVDGNSIRRGEAISHLAVPQVDGLVATYTGEYDNRTRIRQAGFETLGRLDDARAEGQPLEPDDPEARTAFADAAYYLYQAPQFYRGSDATTRVLLAAAHTRVFDVAPRLPRDIDVQAYIVGQQPFRDYLNQNLTVVPRQATDGPKLAAAHDRAAQVRHPHQTAAHQER